MPKLINDAYVFTREEFFALVWEKATVQIARQYGVSDVAIAKLCKKHKIPKPPLGYWARVLHGQDLPKPPLPECTERRLQEIRIRAYLKSEIERKNDVADKLSKAGPVALPDNLDDAHPLIRSELATQGTQGVSTKPGERFNVVVSESNRVRAFRLLDLVIRTLSEHGFSVENEKSERYGHSGNEGWVTYARRRKDKVHFSIREWSPEVLRLVIDESLRLNQRYWADTVNRSLEERVGEFIVVLISVAERFKDERIKREKTEEAERRRERLEEKRLREKEAHASKVRELCTLLKCQERAEAVRVLIKSFEGAGKMSQELSGWIVWARNYADSIDPVIAARDGRKFIPPEDLLVTAEKENSAPSSPSASSDSNHGWMWQAWRRNR